ncbi:MAG: S41 family peptidase [Candidatus Pacebacteria bacterium]|nr:S41 family peptidase [Candidatus Paceibacterota bacterium]
MHKPLEHQTRGDLRTFRWAAVAVAAVLFAFGGGMFLGASQSGAMAFAAAYSAVAPNAPEGVDMTPVWRAWQIIDERYVPGRIATTTATSTPTGATDPQERVWGMIQGLASSLRDPYTVFLPPTDAEIFEADISGAFEGVGMEIAVRSGILTVVSPLKDSPAEKAGLRAADIIAKIDDRDTAGMDVSEAVKIIRGTKGTQVTFLIYREGEKEALTIKVTRDVINIPTIKSETIDGVFIISLYNFSAVSSDVFRKELQSFVDSGNDKLILDLRGNPGGYLQASVDMASWFLPAGKVVVTEDYGKRADPIVHRSRGYNIFNENLKMVILVDKGSASASEILAGALRHYKIATLVGMPTFGKGSVQELVDITPETSLKITVARWLGPDDVQIPDIGIAPDIEVKPTDKDREEANDVQRKRAIEFLKTGK